ncbi:MAG: methyltransferase domain-containing protein [Defluviitaleaceae bacterium]|nr:methyltransferase domain-containing protein [Defluviitaleaceae bacterium]
MEEYNHGDIISMLNLNGQDADIYKIQLMHRLKLIDFWGIKPGKHVFEVGCGQGDTTTALAHVVGANGQVYGIDIAPPTYGAPETLGQARDRILNSAIANRVQMHFNFDVLQNYGDFKPGQFDYAVLSHCLWYLSSYDELVKLLSTVKKFCKKLCIAEWNPAINLPTQLPHYNAVLIQAICESFASTSFSNIKTMFYPTDIINAVNKSGWTVQKTQNIYTQEMQDGMWEVSTVTQEYKNRIKSIPTIPHKLRALLLSQIDELCSADNIKPMSAFCLVAEAH